MLKFYYAPWSRSAGVHWLLEELGIDYEPVHVDIRAEGGVPEDYRAIQPNKKVPAIDHDGTVVTERAAITLYLGDAFPEAGLTPAIGDPARAKYLTWTVYCDSVFDPCVAMRAQGHTDYGGNSFSFGLFDDMVANVERHLTANAYAAGDRFTAADTHLATSIAFTMNVIRVLPERAAFTDYLARIAERPAYLRYQQQELEAARASPLLRRRFAALRE
jgi:glutathione S-transferase